MARPSQKVDQFSGAMGTTKTTGSGDRHRSFPGGISPWKSSASRLPSWWFQIFFIFTPIPVEMIEFDEHIFQSGGSITN